MLPIDDHSSLPRGLVNLPCGRVKVVLLFRIADLIHRTAAVIEAKFPVRSPLNFVGNHLYRYILSLL